MYNSPRNVTLCRRRTLLPQRQRIRRTIARAINTHASTGRCQLIVRRHGRNDGDRPPAAIFAAAHLPIGPCPGCDVICLLADRFSPRSLVPRRPQPTCSPATFNLFDPKSYLFIYLLKRTD